MKHFFFLFFISFAFVSCDNDDSNYELVTVAKAKVISKADLRAQIEVESPKPITNTGKFYFYQDYIFVNDGEGVHIIDNRNPDSPQKISYIKVPGTKDMEVKDDILYVDSYSDLVLFDLSNINDIVPLDVFEDVFNGYDRVIPAVEQQVDFYDYGTFDFDQNIIVGWEYSQEIRRIDPNPPIYFDDAVSENSDGGGGDIGEGGSFASFKIVKDYLYTVDRSTLYVFDISNGKDPVAMGQENVGWNIETIFNKEDYLYIGSSNGMFIYDILNAEAPSKVTSISHITGCDPVVVDGDYAYLTLRGGNNCGQDLSFLEVIDITNKSNPLILGDYDMDEPYGLGTHSDFLFVSDGPNGLKIYNKTNPRDLKLVEVKEDLNIFDVIPLQDKLLLIGDGMLHQYHYSGNSLELISTFSLN